MALVGKAKQQKRSLFTPRASLHTYDRLRLNLSARDAAKTSARGRWRAIVTHRRTGNRYVVRGAPCGLPCYCDAVVVRRLPLARAHR